MRRFGMMAVVAVGWLVGPGEAARGEWVTFLFTAEDAGGRTLAGGWTYHTGIGPYILWGSIDRADPVGGAEFPYQPAFAFAQVDGIRASFSTFDGPRPGLMESYLSNDRPGDFYALTIFARESQLELRLTDDDGTAFDTRLRLPGQFDLDDFEGRTASFRISGLVSFSGEITSITRSPAVILPEPSTLALCGVAAGGIALAARRRRAA